MARWNVTARFAAEGFDVGARSIRQTSQAAEESAQAIERLDRVARVTGIVLGQVAVQVATNWDVLRAAITGAGKQAVTSQVGMALLRGSLVGIAGAAGPAAVVIGTLAVAVGGLKVAHSAAAGLVSLARASVETGSAYQQLRTQLVTVTGSHEAAAAAFARVAAFAKRTPFEVAEITQAYIRLTALGLEPTTARLEAFGNVAAANGKTIMQFAEAVADASVGEFERLKEFGIKARKEGDQVALTFRGATTSVRADAESIVSYLERIGATDFAGGMAMQSATAAGAASNLADAWSEAKDRLFGLGIGDIYTEWTRLQTGMVSGAAEVSPALEDVRVVLGFVADAITVARVAIEGEIGILRTNIEILTRVKGTTDLVIGGLGLFSQAVDRVTFAFGLLRLEAEAARLEAEKLGGISGSGVPRGIGVDATKPQSEAPRVDQFAEDEREYWEWRREEIKRQGEEQARQAERRLAEIERWREAAERSFRSIQRIVGPEGKSIWLEAFDPAAARKAIEQMGRQIGDSLAKVGRDFAGDLQREIDAELARSEAILVAKVQLDLELRAVATDVRTSLLPLRQQMEREVVAAMERVNAAVAAGHLSQRDAAEHEARLRGRMEADFADRRLGEWAGFLGSLGHLFGGFFSQIASAAQNVQSAMQSGQQLGGMLGAAGGAGQSAQWAATAGYMFATVAIFYEVYKAVDAHIKRGKQRIYGSEASIDVGHGGSSSPSFFGPAGNDLSRALRQQLDAILDVLGHFATADLEKIVIKMRNDGKHFSAQVGDVFLGLFRSAEEAMEAAIAYAISRGEFRGVSSMMAEALRNMIGRTVDEIRDSLELVRTLETQNLEPIALQMQAAMDLAVEQFRRAQELFAHNLPVLAEATASIMTRFSSSMWDIYNQLTGRREDPAEEQRRRVAAYNAQRAIMVAQLTLLYEEIRARIALYQAQRLNLGMFGGGGGGLFGGPTAPPPSGGIGGVGGAPAKGGWMPGAPPPDSRNPSGDPQLAALLTILDELARALQGLPPAIGEGEGRRRGGGTGGGAARREGVRDFIDDRRREIALEGASDLARQLDDLNRVYAEQLEAAGKDKQLREQLLALQRQEQAILEERAKKALVDKFQEFLGLVNPFDRLRRSAKDLVEEIEDSPFGDERKARMIGRVLEDLERQVERMAQEMAVGLMGQMLQDLERFGAEEQLLADVRRNMAILEHTLKMAHYQAEIEILRAQGKLPPEVMRALDEAFRFLAGVDPTKLFAPPTDPAPVPWAWRQTGSGYYTGPRGGEGGGKSIDDLVERARRIMDAWAGRGGLSIHRELEQLESELAIVRQAFGDTAEVQAAYLAAVKSTIDNFLEGTRRAQRDLAFADVSIYDLTQQRDLLLAEARLAREKFRGGDLSVVEGAGDLVMQLLGIARQVSPVGSEGYAEIFREWNAFLSEILAETPAKLGMPGNPMAVAGMADLAAAAQDQLNVLYRAERFWERAADSLASIDSKVSSSSVSIGAGVA